MKKLLQGGRVVDPVNGIDGVRDILIDGDRIVRIGAGLPADDATVVAIPAGLVICPGFIDMHVHLREPGQEHKETVATADAVPVATVSLCSWPGSRRCTCMSMTVSYTHLTLPTKA